MQLAALPEGKLKELFREGSLRSKASLLKTRKLSKYQTFAWTLQGKCSKKKSKKVKENPHVGVPH